MNTPFSKSKVKRQRSSSSEENSSFMKNVTSRMSSLLPSTIARWFNNNSSNANGSTFRAEGNDSSTEDEAPETPAKRICLAPPSKCNNYDIRDINSSNTESFTTIEYAPNREHIRREVITSTSSTLNEMEKFDRKNREPDNTTFRSQHTVAAIGKSVAVKRKSLFDLKHDNSTRSNERPESVIKQTFNPVLLGSPFYAGRTMYGGANSCYMNTPNIKRKKAAVVNKNYSSNDSCVMSSSARRVMDLLEHCSSPLNEAKRISQCTNTSMHETKNDWIAKTSYPLSPKYQELYVPSNANVINLQRKSRLANMTSTARQLLASHSSTDPMVDPMIHKKRDDGDYNPSEKMTTKVKRKLTPSQRGARPDFDEADAPAVNLPSVPLPIGENNLPTFSFRNSQLLTSTTFKAPSVLSADHPQPAATILTKFSEAEKIVPTTGATNIYIFSSPVNISYSTHDSSISPNIKFGESAKVGVIVENKEKKRNETLIENNKKDTEKNKSQWQCPDCWVKNEFYAQKCVCCGCKAPVKDEGKSHSVADAQPDHNKCTNCSEPSKTPVKTPASNINLAPKNQWKCEECWVGNDIGADKCICCGTSKSKTSKPATEKSNIPIEKDWKCDVCWITNKSNVEKCAACGEAKPGLTKVVPSQKPLEKILKIEKSKVFEDVAKAQKSDKWECPICLVSNARNLSMCACCDAPRETFKGEPVKFNFGMNTNNPFKFGIPPKEQEANLGKNSFDDKRKSEKSEANNNNLAETPSFTFTLPTKKSEDKLDSAPKQLEEPKMQFKFGINNSTITNQASKEVSSNVKAPEPPKAIETDENPQEVPSVNLFNPKPSNATPVTPSIGFSLGQFKSPNDTVRTETTSNLPAFQPPAARETSPPQNNFTFSAGTNANAGLFSAEPKTTPATTISFGLPVQSNVQQSATVTSPTLLFQKTESVITTTSTTGIFAKSEPSNASTVPLFSNPGEGNVPAPVTTAAISSSTFTFGANASQNNTSFEKPQFLFTFGNNKTDSLSTFKPVFGSNMDSSVNKFGISTGNALGSNIGQTGTALGGSNVLSASNILSAGQNMRPPSGLSANTNTSLGGNAFGSGNTLGNAFGSNTIPGNGLGPNHTLGGNGLNTGNQIGANSLNVSNAMNSGNGLPGNGIGTDNAIGVNSLNNNNTLGSNTMPGTLSLGGNGLGTGNTHGSNNMFANPSPSPAFSLQSSTTAPSLFGQPVQKDMWSASNTASPNLGISNTTLEKPAAFTFGSNTAFNNANSSSAFGNGAQNTSNVFGMNQNQGMASPPSIFSTSQRNQSTPHIFGSPTMNNNPTPAPNIFSASGVSATPTFGSPNSSIPSFETPSLNNAPAPAFNFGAPQNTGGVFGFGQHQQQPSQPPGVYNFGAAGGAPQVQFNMGSAPVMAGRRVRKAVRRTTQR